MTESFREEIARLTQNSSFPSLIFLLNTATLVDEDLTFIVDQSASVVHEMAVCETGSRFLRLLFIKLEALNLQYEILQLFTSFTINETKMISTLTSHGFGCQTLSTMLKHCPNMKNDVLSTLESMFITILTNSADINPLLTWIFNDEPGRLESLLGQISNRLPSVSMENYGFKNLMHILESATVEVQLNFVSKLGQNFWHLAFEKKGSVMLQGLVSLPNKDVGRVLATKLTGHFTPVAMNMFGSYLVAEFFKEGDMLCCRQITQELSPSFSPLIFHRCGSFVIEAMIRWFKKTEQPLDNLLENIITAKRHNLIAHESGREVWGTYARSYGPFPFF